MSFTGFATAIAAFLFLLNSANFVVRILIDLTGVEVARRRPRATPQPTKTPSRSGRSSRAAGSSARSSGS